MKTNMRIFDLKQGFAKVFVARAFAITLALTAPQLAAGPGHDHGPAPAKAVANQSPRVSSHSDLFELVAVADKGQLVIYLDRYGSNEPVTKATVEVEFGKTKGLAALQADGTFLFKNELLTKPGSIPTSFTVNDGKDTDVLAGDLVIPDSHAGHDHGGGSSFKTLATGGLVALLMLILLVLVWWMRRKRRAKAMFTAFALTTLLAAGTALDVHAGPGHDHGDEAPSANANAPKRQSDGSVFLPKASQRLLLVRTTLAQQSDSAKTIELAGRVIADPNAAGKVQPTQAGRIEASAKGMPALGQAVRKGEVLAVVRSSVSAIERANQTATGLETQVSIELSKKRLARLEQLEGTVPQKDIETARAELQSLQQRSKAIGGSAVAVETLLAPVSGVVAAINVVAGQVVDAREVLFEIVDPARLMVEANAFDASLPSNVASAALGLGNASVKLRYLGAGRSLREGAIPLMFRTETNEALPLSVNQSVKVILQTKEVVKGIVVPLGAIVKNPSNQDIVWVHTEAEQFEPRVIRFAMVDGANVSVLDGLKAGERVVTQGASLVNQVR